MDEEERSHLEIMLETYRKRLRKLEEQQALFGSLTPPHIVIEVDDLREKIHQLTVQLNQPASTEQAATVVKQIEEIRTIVPAPHVFISYSRKNADAIEELCMELRIRGLRVWRDVDNLDVGRMTKTEIQHALNEVDAVILYLTRESLKSDYILSIELPEIIARHSREPSFPIISILDGVTFEQIDRVAKATGQRLSEFNAIPLSSQAPDMTRRSDFSLVARRILGGVLPMHMRGISPKQAIGVDLFTYSETGYDYPSQIRLDWVKPFKSYPPSQDTWRALLSALSDLQEILRKEALRPIALRPTGTHLSSGYAFGYIFRETTGFQLWVEQRFPPATAISPQWWRSDQQPAEESPLRDLDPEELDAQGRDITIEISTRQSVEDHVTQWLETEKLSVHKRVRLAPPADSAPDILLTGPQALAIARQVRTAILQHRRKPGRVHLFGAVPIGLAVLIGAQLNACGAIQCYELVRDAYQPSCLLGG